jgi:hypothetical protein
MITVTNLRKIFTEQGVKGASKWKREDFESAIIAAEFAAISEAGEREAIAAIQAATAAPVKITTITAQPQKGKCTECGRKEDFQLSGLCTACREYGEWENAHSDEGHANQEFPVRDELTADCQVCHPELDGRKPKRVGRSRAGMVIVAKGTEIHKSKTFQAAAEAAGWTVTMQSETYELPEGATGEGTRYYATATKGESHIALAWDGRAYDYQESGASFNGKSRKVRNLKEALRIL